METEPSAVPIGSGKDQGFSPAILDPGQVAFGFAFFKDSVPAGVIFELKVIYLDEASSTRTNLQVTQANAGTNPDSPTVVGAVKNIGKSTLKSFIDVDVYCFNSTDTYVDSFSGTADGGDLASGDAASYSVGTLSCPTFLVGSWSIG